MILLASSSESLAVLAIVKATPRFESSFLAVPTLSFAMILSPSIVLLVWLMLICPKCANIQPLWVISQSLIGSFPVWQTIDQQTSLALLNVLATVFCSVSVCVASPFHWPPVHCTVLLSASLLCLSTVPQVQVPARYFACLPCARAFVPSFLRSAYLSVCVIIFY